MAVSLRNSGALMFSALNPFSRFLDSDTQWLTYSWMSSRLSSNVSSLLVAFDRPLEISAVTRLDTRSFRGRLDRLLSRLSRSASWLSVLHSSRPSRMTKISLLASLMASLNSSW